MSLINTDDFVLIGPGSEWFWTAVSGLVLAVTFIAIYRQLAQTRSASAFEQLGRLDETYGSERSLRHQLTLLEALQSGTPAELLPEGSVTYVTGFWETPASLVRAGHIDAKVVYSVFGPNIRYWWAVTAPNTRKYRDETGIRCLEHFEWLAGRMAELDRARGIHTEIDDAFVKASLSRRVGWLREDIRLAEQLRSVVVLPAVGVAKKETSARRARSATPAKTPERR